ncbi:glycosyltransferase, partial [Candidatus Roizmanbacteria bacterium]|nr:glycosyltransferase [Candidatus Roizmanbacteria bacterium]
MMKVAFVRGSYLNAFEGQNYVFNDEIRLTGFSSLRPIHTRLPFPTVRLPSLADISSSRLWRALLNRMIGDRQNLWGLENFAGRFDIFHTADPHYFYSYQLARLRQRGLIKYLIATVWETVPFRNESVARKKKIKKYTLANTDLFLVHTARAKQALVAEGVAKEKIRFVRLGVDLRRFHPLEKAKKFAGKVLYVGRLVEEKGAVDAYEIFRSLPLNTVLTIVGDGP